MFVYYQQNDWSEKLAIVEFAANSNKSAFTKLFSFFINKNLHSRISFDIVNHSNTGTSKQIAK